MLVTPGVGSHDGTPATVFFGDGGATTDLEDAANVLTYSWDWENDGVVDATGVTSTHSYAAAGTFDARLTVQDTGGLSATATFLVIVRSVANVLLVTTAVDENNPGATPASPGGTGFSLREAMTFANITANKQSILVPSGLVINLVDELPQLTDATGLDIVGDGAVIDGAGTGAPDDCFQIHTSNTRVFGFEIQNCRNSPLKMVLGTNCQFSRLDIHDNVGAVVLDGSGNTLGPNNQVSGSGGEGVSVVGNTMTIAWNEIRDNTLRGINLTGTSDGSLVIGNLITGNNPGMFLGGNSNLQVIVHNTLHANGTGGITVGNSLSGNTLRNNIFSENAGFGLDASEAEFPVHDHNDYFGNTLGDCSDCASLGTGSLTDDPLFIDATLNDFRLDPASTCVDAGLDTGHDVNGAAPGDGLFNGASPDIGAREAP